MFIMYNSSRSVNTKSLVSQEHNLQLEFIITNINESVFFIRVLVKYNAAQINRFDSLFRLETFYLSYMQSDLSEINFYI